MTRGYHQQLLGKLLGWSEMVVGCCPGSGLAVGAVAAVATVEAIIGRQTSSVNAVLLPFVAVLLKLS